MPRGFEDGHRKTKKSETKSRDSILKDRKDIMKTKIIRISNLYYYFDRTITQEEPCTKEYSLVETNTSGMLQKVALKFRIKYL